MEKSNSINIIELRKDIHGIKNDLNAMMGFLQILKKKYKPEDETFEQVSSTLECGQSLLEKINALRNKLIGEAKAS